MLCYASFFPLFSSVLVPQIHSNVKLYFPNVMLAVIPTLTLTKTGERGRKVIVKSSGEGNACCILYLKEQDSPIKLTSFAIVKNS